MMNATALAPYLEPALHRWLERRTDIEEAVLGMYADDLAAMCKKLPVVRLAFERMDRDEKISARTCIDAISSSANTMRMEQEELDRCDSVWKEIRDRHERRRYLAQMEDQKRRKAGRTVLAVEIEKALGKMK